MQEMNYGCGTTVHPIELSKAPTVLYGCWGRQHYNLPIFSRRAGAVIAVDPVGNAPGSCAVPQIAAKENPWFDPSFVEIREGDAFALPVPDTSVDVVAQNCLFNIFEPTDLSRFRKHFGLKPGGRLQMSDQLPPSHPSASATR